MGVSKLSAKVFFFFKVNYSFKQLCATLLNNLIMPSWFHQMVLCYDKIQFCFWL